MLVAYHDTKWWDQWAAGNIRARDRLPVLLRRLIHAGRREPRRVDFPGYDDAQRYGWDGWVEADSATSWVPEGRSGWELSVDARPRAKAERDYQARLKMLSQAERADCTFVFVTPRNWAGKVEWERGKAAAEDWKAVRALDASDLEQWLEETTAPRIWLAHELDLPTKGFETLDHFWERWAAASDAHVGADLRTGRGRPPGRLPEVDREDARPPPDRRRRLPGGGCRVRRVPVAR